MSKINDFVHVKFLFIFTDKYGIRHEIGDIVVCKKLQGGYSLFRGGQEYDRISDKVVKEI